MRRRMHCLSVILSVMLMPSAAWPREVRLAVFTLGNARGLGRRKTGAVAMRRVAMEASSERFPVVN